MEHFDSSTQARNGYARLTHADMARMGKTAVKRGVDPVTGKSYTIYADDRDLPKPDHDYRRPAEEMQYPTRMLIQLQGGHHPDEYTPERDLVVADDLEPGGSGVTSGMYEDYRSAFVEDLVRRNLTGTREPIAYELDDGRKTGYLGYQKIMRVAPYLPPTQRSFDLRDKPKAMANAAMTEGNAWDADPRRPQQRTGSANRAGNVNMRDSQIEGIDTDTTRSDTQRQGTTGEVARGRMPITVPGFNAGSTEYKTDRPGTQRPGTEQEIARGRMPITVPGFNAGSTEYKTDRPGTQRPGTEQEVARGRMPITVPGFNAGTVRTSSERPGPQKVGDYTEVAHGRMPVQAAVHNAGGVRTSSERPGPQKVGDYTEVAHGRMPVQAAVHNAGGVRTTTERPGTQRPGETNQMPLFQSLVGTVTQGLQAAADAFTQRARRGVADSVTTDNLAAYQDGLARDINAPGIQGEAPSAPNDRKGHFDSRLDNDGWGADNGDASGFDLFGAQSLRKPRSRADDTALQAQIMSQSNDRAMYSHLPNPGYFA
jgi:hypothetical protein